MFSNHPSDTIELSRSEGPDITTGLLTKEAGRWQPNWISTLGDGQAMRAYVSKPEAMEKISGIIVTTEVFGVNKPNQKPNQDVTDGLSGKDYMAVAPVLYHRLGSNPLCRQKRCLSAHTRLVPKE